MEFRSKAQRRYLHQHHPRLAADMELQTPNAAQLPEHTPIKAKRRRHRKKR